MFKLIRSAIVLFLFFVMLIAGLHFTDIWPIPAIDQLMNGTATLDKVEQIEEYGKVTPVRRIEYTDVEVTAGNKFTITLVRGLNDGLGSDCIPFDVFNRRVQIYYTSKKTSTCTFFIDFRDPNIFGINDTTKTFYVVDQFIPNKICGNIKKDEYFEPICFPNLEEIPNEKTRLQIQNKKDFADNQISDEFNKMAEEHPQLEAIKKEAQIVREEIISYYLKIGYTQVPPPAFKN